MSPVILLLSALPASAESRLQQCGAMVRAVTAADRRAAISEHAGSIRIVVTTGAAGLTADEMDALPALQLVSSIGVGYEGIDVGHARSRGIEVTHGPGTNADAVADHAFALLLASARCVRVNHDAVRDGVQRNDLPMPDQISGRRLGVLGMGQVGTRIAQRATGFAMEVGYTALARRDDLGYRFFDDLTGMARWCDVLVLAAPGGAGTDRIVDAQVIDALGPDGYLVNVARGSILDEQALVVALEAGKLRAAALDVYDDEPAVPARLVDQPKVLLSPHIAGRSPKAMDNMVDLLVDNIQRFLQGKPLATPVP